CLGIITDDGLVMAADSRTNAGVDNISTYQKLFNFSLPNERVLLLCTAGNLSVTQVVLNGLERDLQVAAENLHSLASLNDVARYIGSKIRQVQEQDRAWLERDRIDFKCSLLLGGQIQGHRPALYLIYSQGNFIQATSETPFLQIGETKYGKPILDRTIRPDTSLEAAAKCALMSIDSTMKSNISVGPPINLVAYEANSFQIRHQLKLRMGDPYLMKIRQHWEISLRQAFDTMPDINWHSSIENFSAIDANS
ncbi:MAG: proteasome-type protease, partial [Microcoleus sp. SIO2G3]|nr:proteasome-type protease [Microcoleus sp. SIO2G3]